MYLLPRVITTFHVPLLRDWPETIEHNKMVEMLEMMPFTCIRIVAPPMQLDVDYVQFDEWVIEAFPHREGDMEGMAHLWSFKRRIVDDGRTETFYTHGPRDTRDAFPFPVLGHLLTLLSKSRNRYIEKPLSRQAKRALGVSVPNYHEYVIVDRRSVKEGEKAARWSEIARRHPHLHAVRAHLRRLECGRLVRVRAHTRGKGTLFQVKDYRVFGGDRASA